MRLSKEKDRELKACQKSLLESSDDAPNTGNPGDAYNQSHGVGKDGQYGEKVNYSNHNKSSKKKMDKGGY